MEIHGTFVRDKSANSSKSSNEYSHNANRNSNLNVINLQPL